MISASAAVRWGSREKPADRKEKENQTVNELKRVVTLREEKLLPEAALCDVTVSVDTPSVEEMLKIEKR